MPWQGHNPAYDAPAWKRARKAALQRARYQCEVNGPGCLGKANTADHVIGIANDPEHTILQAICRVCHAVKTSAESRAHYAQHDPEPRPRTNW